MRLITTNIQHGVNASGSIGDLVEVGRELAALSPDVIAVQEIDYRQPRTGFADQVDQLRQGLGWQRQNCIFSAHFSGPARGLRLPAICQYSRGIVANTLRYLCDARRPLAGGYGVALLSRHPLNQVVTLRLGAAAVSIRRTDNAGIFNTGFTGYFGQNRNLLAATVIIDSQPCRVGVAHLELGRDTAKRQLFTSWSFLNRNWDGPAFLAGDMNLPDSMVRQVSGVGVDCDASAPTFPADDPHATIDHVLAAGPVELTEVTTHRLSVGDHLCLAADFSLHT